MQHGRVVKRTGDGSIVEFRSVVDAVRCAIAQLISTESGAHVWADRFEGERAKLGQLQVEVVARVANALGAALVRAESLRTLREHPDNPDAVDLALRAKIAAQRMDNEEAMGEYEQALKLDPNSTRAQTGLAVVLANLATYQGATDRDAYLDRAESLADQALHAHPDYGFALFAKARAIDDWMNRVRRCNRRRFVNRQSTRAPARRCMSGK